MSSDNNKERMETINRHLWSSGAAAVSYTHMTLPTNHTV